MRLVIVSEMTSESTQGCQSPMQAWAALLITHKVCQLHALGLYSGYTCAIAGQTCSKTYCCKLA